MDMAYFAIVTVARWMRCMIAERERKRREEGRRDGRAGWRE
jgi:hypothetical protein